MQNSTKNSYEIGGQSIFNMKKTTVCYWSFAHFIAAQRRSQAVAEGSHALPLSHHNIDVYFFLFFTNIEVEMGCIAEYPLAVRQGVETHLLSNQAIMNFRGLRNIEAAFFIPAWFVLPPSDGFTHGP